MGTLADLAVRLAAGETTFVLRRWRRKTIVFSLIGGLAVTAYGAGIMALVLALAPVVGPAVAALLVALAALAMALLLIATIWLADLLRDRPARTGTALATSAAASLVPPLIRSASPLTLLVLGGAGLLVADHVLDNPKRD